MKTKTVFAAFAFVLLMPTAAFAGPHPDNGDGDILSPNLNTSPINVVVCMPKTCTR